MILISYFRYYNYYLWPLDSICLLLSPTFTALLLFYGQHSLCDRCRKMGAYQWPQFISNRFLFILFLRQFLFCSTFFVLFLRLFCLIWCSRWVGACLYMGVDTCIDPLGRFILFFCSCLVRFRTPSLYGKEKKKYL